MPKTKNESTLEQLIEDVRVAQAATEAKILELSAELNAIPERLKAVDWSDEEQAVLEVATLEGRRMAIPHHVRSLRRKAIEQELAALRLEGEELETRRAPLEERVEQTRATFEEARREYNLAQADQHELLYGAMSDNRHAISDAEKRLAELDRETPTEAAPPVRSVWQMNMNRPGPENYQQDTPGALHFGSANTADKPLREGGEQDATVVIPTEAIKEAEAG